MINERVRKLARQSTGASTIYMLEEEWEKFAELIIEECISLSLDLSKNDTDATIRIKEHFGVSP